MLANHVWEMCSAAVLLLGPIPLSLGITANRIRVGHSGTGHFCLSTLVLWCLIQTSAGILLGLAHELSRQGLMTVELVVFAVGLVMVKFYRPQLGLLSVQASFRRQPLDVGEMFIVAATGFVGVALLRSLLQDPIDDYDSLAWHLPIMATWYQSGSLSISTITGTFTRGIHSAGKYSARSFLLPIWRRLSCGPP